MDNPESLTSSEGLFGITQEPIREASQRNSQSTDITTHTLKMSDIPSPYTNFNFEEISELNFPIPEFSLLNPREPEHQQTSYDRQLTLTELVMKKLSSLGKALDVFGHYDDENDGFITVSQLKKCLEQISVVFTDQEFTMVFKDYLEAPKDREESLFAYIKFLSSWDQIDFEEATPLVRKRATTEDNIGCNTMHRTKRLSFHTTNERELDRLKNDIYTHIISKFGKYKSIFKSLSTSGNTMYISDFSKYLNENKVVCTINQLVTIMSAYTMRSDRASWEEFERFILSIQRHDEMNLTAAFPNTFGISPHIDMCKRDDKEDQENNEVESPGIRRTKTVTSNLNKLSLFYSMVNQ